MVSATASKTLPMTCKGGVHCCQRGSGMCGKGEGDCKSNADCDGLLECGNHNSVTEFGKWGGLWIVRMIAARGNVQRTDHVV